MNHMDKIYISENDDSTLIGRTLYNLSRLIYRCNNSKSGIEKLSTVLQKCDSQIYKYYYKVNCDSEGEFLIYIDQDLYGHFTIKSVEKIVDSN